MRPSRGQPWLRSALDATEREDDATECADDATEFTEDATEYTEDATENELFCKDLSTESALFEKIQIVWHLASWAEHMSQPISNKIVTN